jgi:monoterpene epsilon-lactone hydrolase
MPLPVGKPSEAHFEVVRMLGDMQQQADGVRGRARIPTLRRLMDDMGAAKEYESDFRPVHAGSVRGEWVLSPGADPRKRLLYIHGGAWFSGSPLSHRPITDRLSRLDYRLLPENRRIEGIDDCHEAYRWVLANGPDGETPLDAFYIAGDSAGGSLTLETIAWARDQQLRPVDAAIAFSPSTDLAMGSPSLRSNIDTDPMLGPMFGKLIKLPLLLQWWMTWFGSRMPPSDPRMSPLRGELHELPPVLLLASEAEMLFDDSRRYAVKAAAAGSQAELATWPFMVHVWPMFTPELPEAEEAYQRIASFVAEQQGEAPANAAA